MEKIQKLNDREKKCNELIANAVYDKAEDPWECFKLSYPPNPKIPFLINDLELRNTEKYGRGVFTKRDLKAGDVIAVENLCFQRLFCPGQYNRCCCCIKVNMMNLLPCTKTGKL